MIAISNLTKSFKNFKAVNDLNMDISNGEILGLAGLNGAGKTTTIRATAGIIFPTSGKILVDNFDMVENKTEASKHIGWVPELPNFEPDSRPIPLLKYYAGFYGINSADAEKDIVELMKKFDIYAYKDKKLKFYSQGMKKRFSLVAAMMGNPDNFLFDETLNGLDPQGVREVRDFIIELKKQGKSILLSSHILSELQNVADRIAIMKNGTIIKILTRDDLNHLGTTGIKIHIKNPDDKLDKVLLNFGQLEYDGYYYMIKNSSNVDPSDINNELVKANYKVDYIGVQNETLEEYFLNMVK
ncbi:ABC transporter ATP-binding protein [Ferroplasma sp.]|uniref:ABC transporter ATP-binding protein n=1 Tax=Ferroplasma sp. TaxID=2591003 RepID=UPI0026356BE9|nr:ABC transporter ATP-binding protein [Ferroplasma sp.]MCL4453647.1 ABC transporter ATP-binding protein [Candidatus Thermoplasmatota archaeon]